MFGIFNKWTSFVRTIFCEIEYKLINKTFLCAYYLKEIITIFYCDNNGYTTILTQLIYLSKHK